MVVLLYVGFIEREIAEWLELGPCFFRLERGTFPTPAHVS